MEEDEMKKIKKNMILFSLTLLLAGVMMVLVKQDVSAANTTRPPVQGVKQAQTRASRATSGVNVSWNAVQLPSEYSGYTVYYKVEYREVKTPEATWSTSSDAWTQTTKFISGLSAGKSYQVRVSAYAAKRDSSSTFPQWDTKDIASASAPIEVVTAPAQDSKFSFKQTKASANSVTISFSAVTGANYYEVGYMSSNMSSYKTVTTNKTTVTLKKLSKNTLTDVYVIPCRKSDAGYTAKSSTKVSGEVALVPSKPSVKYVRVDKSKKEMNIYPKDKSGRYADGFQYQIYRVYKNKKLASKTSERGSYYTYSNKAIGNRDLFKVRVRAYKVSTDGKKFYSDWSSWNYCSDYKTVKSVKSKGASGIEVKWNKVRGAKGYKIYAAKKNGDDSYKVVATIKNGNTTRATFNKLNKKALKKNQRYYVYVEPYFKSGDKTIKVNNGYYKYCTLIYKK